jgi:3-oxoacyl-[acyl-carrier protein] reductase
MSTPPAQKVMLITGTRKGIGQYLAQTYAARGWRVIGCSRREPDWQAENYEHVLTDISDETQVTALFRHIRQQYGRLDAALNNAGIASMNHVLLTPASSVQSVLNTNFLGTFLVCREAAKLMMKHKSGRIVNFSTVAVPLDLEGDAVYAASKAAVEKFTRIFAREIGPLGGPFGITVNTIGPAPIDTDLIRNVPPEKIAKLIDALALKRGSTFEDVLHTVDFLIDPASGAVTGQTIYLGGA